MKVASRVLLVEIDGAMVHEVDGGLAAVFTMEGVASLRALAAATFLMTPTTLPGR